MASAGSVGTGTMHACLFVDNMTTSFHFMLLILDDSNIMNCYLLSFQFDMAPTKYFSNLPCLPGSSIILFHKRTKYPS